MFPDYQYIQKIEIDKGRFINIKDFKNKEKVVVIGKLVENDLFFKDLDFNSITKFVNDGKKICRSLFSVVIVVVV